jgi:hypothetical protein
MREEWFMGATRRREARGVDVSDSWWLMPPPMCEFLETRQLFSGTVEKLALVHQELHRPPTALLHYELHRPPTAVADFNRDGFADVAEMTVHSKAGAGGAEGDGIGIDLWLNDGKGSLLFAGHTDCDDTDPDRVVVAADIAAGDVDGDGVADVVAKMFSVTGQTEPVGSEAKVTMHVMSGDGKGALLHTAAHEAAHVVQQREGVALRIVPPDEGKDSISVADLDGDGVGDIISVYNDELSISLMGRLNTVKQVT